jgi:Leucine-rich repeat (LRR) protein
MFLINCSFSSGRDLADNEFNGIFPDTIEVLPELTYVDVSKQRAFSNGGISGFLPAFASATKLSKLFLQENDFFGVIPENFLSSSTSTELTVDIRSNRLNGTIPTGLNRYQNANFLLADNQFNAVPSELCSLGWNSGTDCDFVLCSPGTFNGIGRETSDLPCEVCPPETENPLALFAGATSCVEGERNVLRDIYYLMGGAQWLHNDGWGTHTDHCEWFGVTCYADGAHAGSVQSLDLRGNNLVGGLLPDIWLLTQMIELDLSDNGITVASFEKIGDAAALQSLKLSNNEVLTLTGIGAAISLENFHCTSCEIGGPIPDELYDLVNLRRLFLNYNQLTGSISSRAQLLRGLRELYLFSNNLRGDIPTELGNRFMEVISLGRNRFSGSIPSQWSLMFNLRVLSLEHEAEEDRPLNIGVRDTGLTGQLPAFESNRQLRELYLSGNALGGTIPSNFLFSVDDVSATIHVDVSNVSIRAPDLPSNLAFSLISPRFLPSFRTCRTSSKAVSRHSLRDSMTLD